MKKTKKLLALLISATMLFALIPAVGGADTVRPLTESERAVRIEKLTGFIDELSALTQRFDSKIAEKNAKDEYALARIVVKYKGELEAPGALAQAEGYNDWHVIQYATPEEAREACLAFSKMKGVEWAEPDEIMTTCATPGSSSFNSWGYGASHINMYEYNQWLYAEYGNSVDNMPTIVVAVTDTGADLDHPYLVSRLVQGYNVVTGTNTPEDGHGHGTHVCGTVVDGTFANVKVMPIKVLSDSGSGSTSQVCAGMEYGYLHGAQVENLSLGGVCDNGEEHYMMSEVVGSAFDNGCTVCVAAGNESDNAANHCPANVERACTVASIGTGHTLSYFSNYGDLVDVAASGESIYSSVTGGGYGNKDGTSMATPHVAAVAAQIKTANPDMSADDVVSAIKGAATPLSSAGAGAGMLHLAANIYTLDPAANAAGQYNHFVSTGSYAWTVDGSSVVSGNAGVNNSTSVLTTQLSLGFEQVLTFDYKVSSEQNKDYLRVKANGQTIFETSGEQAWQTCTVTVPGSGSVALTFEFAKDSSGASGSDKAWIRNVKLTNSLSSAANASGGRLTFESSGAYPWIADDAVHAAKSGNAGVNNSVSTMTTSAEVGKGMQVVFKYKVSAASGDSFSFKVDGRNIFTTGSTSDFVEYIYTASSSGMHTFTFEFRKGASGSSGDDCAYVKNFSYYHSFESAVNGSDDFLPIVNDEEYPWFPMGDAVCSSNWSEGSSQSNMLLTLNMTAGETLTFQYRSSSESNYDFFRFYVDNTQQVQQSGNNTSWSTYTFTATQTKSYTFKWSYEKDVSVDSYDDCAYVRDVTYSGTYNLADGDVNGDGVVDSADALLVLRWSMNLIDDSMLDLSRADVNGDGVVDSSDALIILRRASSL